MSSTIKQTSLIQRITENALNGLPVVAADVIDLAKLMNTNSEKALGRENRLQATLKTMQNEINNLKSLTLPISSKTTDPTMTSNNEALNKSCTDSDSDSCAVADAITCLLASKLKRVTRPFMGCHTAMLIKL